MIYLSNGTPVQLRLNCLIGRQIVQIARVGYLEDCILVIHIFSATNHIRSGIFFVIAGNFMRRQFLILSGMIDDFTVGVNSSPAVNFA